MALPQLSPEQRSAALVKAAEARTQRAAAKSKLKAGKLKLSQFLRTAQGEQALEKMRVRALLESLPGVGAATARRIMEDVGIAAERRVRGLGPKQRTELVKRFG